MFQALVNRRPFSKYTPVLETRCCLSDRLPGTLNQNIKIMEQRFIDFKEEILKRAKEVKACKEQYGRAYKSESFPELMEVIKYNFSFACSRKVIEPSIIEKYKEEFNENGIWCNVDNCTSGFLLVSNAQISNISGNTICQVRDNATVQDVRDNATVLYVRDNAPVQDVRDNATVQ